MRRLPVAERQVVELSPLVVALHEMRQRVADLDEVVYCAPPDVKRLQLLLQVTLKEQNFALFKGIIVGLITIFVGFFHFNTFEIHS